MLRKKTNTTLLLLLTILLVFINACGNGNINKDYDIDSIVGQTEFISEGLSGAYSMDGLETADAATGQVSEVTREITEADIVKISGSSIYILNRHKGLIICNIATPSQPYISGVLPLSGIPVEMYIRNNTALILTNTSGQGNCSIGTMEMTTESLSSSRLYLVDIANTAVPEIIESKQLPGIITESRIVGSVLYTVTTAGLHTPENGYTADTFINSFYIENYNTLTAIDKKSFENGTNYIHVTDSAIFSVKNQWDKTPSSHIRYIDISDPGGKIIVRGDIALRGQVYDKFKLDAFNGNLRVCTFDQNKRESVLHIISLDNPEMPVLTSTLIVGQGERLYATRFDGETAYLVTFRRIDPLWVINLSNPEKPVIAGELEVPGWSVHIEVRNKRLIALGVDNTAQGNKVAVSYFNVENPSSPQLINRLSFGEDNGWSYSNGYYDDKAFKIIDALGLILLPYSSTVNNEGQYFRENRLQLISFTDNDIKARGAITQNGSVLRSGVYENSLFAVSNDELNVIDASDPDNPSLLANLTLSQNVRKIIRLTDDHAVLAVDKSNGTTVLQSIALAAPDIPLCSELNIGSDVSEIISENNMLYVVSNSGYETYLETNTAASLVTAYDFSVVDSPQRKGSINVSGNYFTEFSSNQGKSLFYNSNKIFRINEHVYLFADTTMPCIYCETPEDAGITKIAGGKEVPSSKLTLIDFTNPDTPTCLSEYSIDNNSYGGFITKGIYNYSYAVSSQSSGASDSVTKFYLGRVNINNPAIPTTLKAVNIPGIAVHSDASGEILFTVNARRNDSNNTYFTINSIRMKNNLATGINSVLIDSHPTDYIAVADRVYLMPGWYYEYDDQMGAVVVADTGNPEKIQTQGITINTDRCYTNLYWADQHNLITDSYGSLNIFDATDPSDINWRREIEVNDYLRSISGSAPEVIAALGYDGISIIGLIPD